MSATVLDIVEKVVPAELYPAVPQNFVVREGGIIPAQVVVDNPNVSLYCLDDEHKRALFVEIPPGIDLAQAPFFYVTQYQQAQRLIAVPYDSLHQLADDLRDVDDHLIFIYSTGRCGSTLISRAFSEIDGVLSLSEPDVYTQLTMMRFADPSRDDEYTRLLKSSTRLLGRGASKVALKFRANVTQIADLLYRAFPNAKNLFLYRNAETWAQSMHSAFSGDAGEIMKDPVFRLFLATHAPLAGTFVERHSRAPDLNETFALTWLSILGKVLAMHDQGMPFLALRYEDIQTQPKRVLAEMLAYCGLPTDGVEHTYTAFSKDSQDGSAISQANRQQSNVSPLSTEEYARIRAVLAEHPVIQTPDFIAPDTLVLGEV